MESPLAIPFCTLNDLCYSCHDPKVNQNTPVELKDADPWPYVKPCPYKYQDNLQVDPCAPFRDETVYKYDYWAKRRCGKNTNYGPTKGYVPPIMPMHGMST